MDFKSDAETLEEVIDCLESSMHRSDFIKSRGKELFEEFQLAIESALFYIGKQAFREAMLEIDKARAIIKRKQ